MLILRLQCRQLVLTLKGPSARLVNIDQWLSHDPLLLVPYCCYLYSLYCILGHCICDGVRSAANLPCQLGAAF